MALARDKLGELEQRLRARADVSGNEERPHVRVVGDLQLLPRDVRIAAARVMQTGSANVDEASRGEGSACRRQRPVVNLCVAYTGREDMAQAAQRCREAVSLGWLHPDDVCEVRSIR
jgi:ditrans,polycis-polyprenyl diphosphate synthase